MVCPGSFVECPTGTRLDCKFLKGPMLSLSGSGSLCLMFSTLSLLGLPSSVIISSSVPRNRYFGGFDFCNK